MDLSRKNRVLASFVVIHNTSNIIIHLQMHLELYVRKCKAHSSDTLKQKYVYFELYNIQCLLN